MSDQKMSLEVMNPELASVPAQAEAGVSLPWLAAVDGTNYSLRSHRAQAEIYAINRALDHVGWNRKRAAQLLRISYRALLYKISRHKITRANGKPVVASSEAGPGSLTA